MNEKNRRGNYIEQGGIASMLMWPILMLFIAKIIYMSYKNGMEGMTYYAYADLLFLGIYILFGLAVVPVMKKMIYFQMNKGSYRNAQKVYRTISGFVLCISGLLAVGLFFFAQSMSEMLFKTVLCTLLIKMMAVAIIFWIPVFCLKGYMEGLGNAVPGMFADLIAGVVGLIVTVLFQPYFAEYGRKVAAVVRQDSYAYAYSVCSGVLGIIIGGLISFLFLLVVKAVFGKEIKQRIRKDEVRKTDSFFDILWNFLSGYVSSILFNHHQMILAIVLVILYCHEQDRSINGVGMIYVSAALIILPIVLMAMQINVPFVRQLTTIMKQLDFHHAREKTSLTLKIVSYSVLPYCAFMIGTAPLIGTLFFDVESAGFDSMLRSCCWIAILVVFGLLFKQSVSVLAKPYMKNVCTAIMPVSGILFYLLLSKNSVTGEDALLYAYMLAGLLYLLVTCFITLKKVRLYSELVESVALPLIAAVISGLTAFGVYVLSGGKMPGIAVFAICVVMAYIVNHVVIIVFRIFKPHEWNVIPGNKIPVLMAKMFGRY